MQRRVDISYSVWGSLWSMHVQCTNLITSFHSNIKDPVIDGCTKIVSCLRGLVYDVLSIGSKKNHLWRRRERKERTSEIHTGLFLYDSVCRLKSGRIGVELEYSNWEQFLEKAQFLYVPLSPPPLPPYPSFPLGHGSSKPRSSVRQ